MVKNQKNDNQNKVRNRLVGLVSFLLILAILAPCILTDKSKLRTSTTPILQPDVVNQQNQIIEPSGDTIDSFTNTTNNNVPDIPYIPDIDQNTDSFISSDISDHVDMSSPTTQLIPPEQESKPYMIQLIALKNRQKIEELVALLRLNNYNVRVIPKNPEPDQLIKLQVGPYAKKEQVEQVIISLNNLTKLKGIIVAN
ncbi:SPOR domain-containing protein [uncultured Gilliamella sp.]|uniref:SPOR domain-containing protein n=1 Tax=uncultured Gilliamella sp. TaxID=1193505 RepID=UPI0025E14147|nr:SPOR domain-containing protein [uncultured Gilliamella sp.]